MKPINIGICGLGTVGYGSFSVLKNNADEISRRLGCILQVVHVAALTPKNQQDLGTVKFSNDAFAVVNDPEVDIVLELIGGCDLARKLVLKAIENGKHVVTANKALIAVHGNEIFKAAKQKGVIIAYEAAVAGGIPIIKVVREGLAANKIEWIAGIINGTSNFILTEMQEKQRAFADVLKEAQELGYAEADPTFDVEGIDAAHKLSILSAIAFGTSLHFEEAYTEGISKITPEDIRYAAELGYRIKHLGISRLTADGIELRVHPTLVEEEKLIAKVDGVMNAVLLHGNAVGSTMYYGAGAGAKPTASAVVADVIDVARQIMNSGLGLPALAFQSDQMDKIRILPIDEIISAYYLRISVLDEVGVMARITDTLKNHGVSIEGIIQKDHRKPGQAIPVIILTHEVKEAEMNKVIAEIEGFESVQNKITRIRVERLDD